MIVKQTTASPQTVVQDGKIADKGDELVMLILTAGSGASAYLKVKDNTVDSGDTIISLRAVQSTSVVLSLPFPLKLENGAYASLTGAGAEVSFAKL